MLRLLIDIGNTTTLAAAAIEGAAGFTTSSLYLAIFNLLAETASSLQVLDMPLVEIDDEDMRVLFNLATRCHTSHLRVHVYLAIFNLLAETASSLQVLDMPLVEIDDEDMRVLFNLATRCHTLRICESMKIDQTLPFLKATVRPRLQGRLHCRYHCSFTICNYMLRLTGKSDYEKCANQIWELIIRLQFTVSYQHKKDLIPSSQTCRYCKSLVIYFT